MKKVQVFLTLLMISFLTVNGDSNNEKIVWKNLSHDFGTIEKGTPVSTSFTFTNESDQAIQITNVVSSCGCTVTEYTKSMIEPGGTGMISATYNAAKPGAFQKSVKVYTNRSENPIMLKLHGTVAQ